MGVNDNARNEIIRKAVLEKLSEGINFFTADDILLVAGIDETQLQQISESIKSETVRIQGKQHKTTPKRKTKG